MKFYKNEWGLKTADDDRKQIATQMASATKNWVSSPDEPVDKKEENKESKDDSGKEEGASKEAEE